MTMLELIGSNVTGIGIIILILSIIQIVPIKINPWSWIAKKIGQGINGEVIEELNSVKKDITLLKQMQEEDQAINSRVRILRFADEIYLNTKHSKEHFDQILSDITAYKTYCETHPDFKNEITVQAIKVIEKVYSKCLEHRSFLNPEEPK